MAAALRIRALLVLTALLSVAAVIRAGGFPIFLYVAAPRVAAAVLSLATLAVYAMPVFFALAVYRIWQADPVAPATPSRTVVLSQANQSLWQLKRAAIIGAVAALTAVLWSLMTNAQMFFPGC